MYDVSGTVTYDGTPVEEGTVTFEDAATAHADQSPLTAGGKFSLKLPKGSFKIAVEPIMVEHAPGPEIEPQMVHKKVDNIPMKYRTARNSGLSVEVSQDEVDVKLEMQKAVK